MAEQPPVSAAARPPLIAKKPPVPWWKQRSKRQPRKVLVNRPRKRGKAAGKNPPPQAQSTDRATHDTLSNSASNMPATKKTNAFKKGRRKKKKKPTLLVLDSWENDGANEPLDASAVDEEEVVLDSWENESVTQQPSTGAFDDGGRRGHENSRGHVTNDSSAATVRSQPNSSNNTRRVYGQVDQGLSANELKTIFQRKRVKGRAQRKLRKRLAASSSKMTAPEHSEILAKINPAVKVESPLLSSPPPLLGRPSIQSPASSNVEPMTSTADVLKNLPPFSGLTSTFDASLSDPVHVPPDHSSLKQPTHERSFPLRSHSLISDRPVPLLDSDDLTSRGNPFKDTITPPMPLRRVTPEEIGARQDPLQLHVPGYVASSTHTTSLIPNLMALSSSAANNTSFTHPSTKLRPLLPTPMSAPLPALRGGGVGEPSRQLKITSFLSPPKKNRLDDPTRLEAEFNASHTLPSVSRVGLSTRPPPLLPPERPGYSGDSFLPPMAQRDRYFPTSKLRDGNSVPLSGLSDQDSVFDRLESTKYHQSHLQFSADQSQRTLELAPPLHDIHDDPFSRLGPSVTSLNALSMSQFGDSYATGSSARILLSSDVDERRPHPYTDRPHLRMDSVISRQASNVVVKLEPDVEYEEDPSFSSRLYQTRPDGLNVAKVLDRFAPKRYQIAGVTPRPQRSTGYALVKQEREVVSVDSQEVSGGGERLVASSSGERFVDIHDSVRNVQQISRPTRDSERTVTEMGVSLTDDSTGQEVATGFQIGDDEVDYSRHVQSTGIHIPLSRKGLKVVAIDCEMVGCIRRIPHEQLLAIHMKGATTKSGAVVTTKATQGKKGGGGGGGLGGVLQKTQMKPQVWTRKERRKLQKGLNKLKEISVAARCSIIAYDTSVLYDKYINPTIGTDFTITNYRTPWSGIRPYHMTGATPFHVARQEILDILRGCIVVGHNIGSDMQSLEIQDIPAAQIRDTSLHPILAKSAGGRALKKMAQSLLGRNIQSKSRVGHCSVEDATATMDLYKLVELEWED